MRMRSELAAVLFIAEARQTRSDTGRAGSEGGGGRRQGSRTKDVLCWEYCRWHEHISCSLICSVRWAGEQYDREVGRHSNRPNLRLYSGTIPQARGSLDGRTRATLERRSRAVQSAGACHKICGAGGASTRALRPGPVGPASCER
ncbi:unnamed protein product [Ectocarpus sp. 13 AM-2016]